ncbi:hypothetical protein [Paenibacillus sp. y28]|uniref:hypothetical protein n=1 Tax=Paenibacillus sp. y28 TaxID=3129110 RepID=UPI00301589B2
MPKVKNVEKRIWEVEDFAVNFLYPGGSNVKGSKEGIPQYPHERRSRNDWTVSEWKKKKFSQAYPGYDVEVLNGDGEPVSGQTKLITVRDSYIEYDETM